MPITYMLLSIYKCEQSTGDSLTDSYFYRDCSQYCYKQKHLVYLIAGSISIVLYLIISTFYRPYWQLKRNLNIETKSSFFSFMSLFQMALILVKINVEVYSEVVQGYLECAVILIMIGIAMKVKPFNFERSNVLLIIILSVDCWIILVSTTSIVFYFYDFFGIMIAFGFIFIASFGFKEYHKHPGIFLSDHNEIIPDLIKFQFAKSITRITFESKHFRKIEKSRNGSYIKGAKVRLVIK